MTHRVRIRSLAWLTVGGGLTLACGEPVGLSLEAERNVSRHASVQTRPAIWGDLVVWEDYRAANSEDFISDIYLVDLGSGVERRLTRDPTDQEEPAIWEHRVVWTDGRRSDEGGAQYDIYLFDVRTGEETRLTTDEGLVWKPDIHGDRVVWWDQRSDPEGGIYLLDLSTSTRTQITSKGGAPRIWGDRVVWTEGRGCSSVFGCRNEVMVYDIRTGLVEQLTDRHSIKEEVSIWEHRVVWSERGRHSDGSLDDWDIHMLELGAGPDVALAESDRPEIKPRIFGDLVVWLEQFGDHGADGTFLTVLDLSNGELRRLGGAGHQDWPAIHERQLVWADARSGDSEIYAARIR